MPVYFRLGCLPPTLNEQTDTARRNKYKSAKIKLQWTEYVSSRCAQLRSLKRNTSVYLECVWFIKNFSRDPDNIEAAAKYIMDGIVKAGVLKDDKLRIIQSPVIHWFEKVDNYDSLVFIFYSKKEWEERKKLGINQPSVEQPDREIPNFSVEVFKRPRKARRNKAFSMKH